MTDISLTGSSFTADRREAIILGAGSLLAAGALSRTAQARDWAGPVAMLGRGQPFDEGWRFHRGGGEGFEVAGLDDSAWRAVDLPHDWSIEDVPGGAGHEQLGPFDKNAVGGTATGFTVGGVGWYRKHFRLDGVPADARVEIAFDGVYGESDVWLNGVHLGEHLHGYAPFAWDLTPHLARDGDNVIAVRARNQGKNSRWYAGSGIYRQVRLDVTPASTRIARWGVAAATRRIADGAADVAVTTALDDAVAGTMLITRLRDATGRVVAEATSSAAAQVEQVLAVRGAHLWSPADPYLHTLESEVRRGDKPTDRVVQDFGIRIVAMDARRGLTVNGERAVLRGGCIHHDNGLLGARAFPQADDRRVRLLKARGYNAIRSSHNPMSASLLDACDRHGMLVINEAFDMWQVAKLPDDYSQYFPSDWKNVIEAMVRSSRNRASVVMWSIGNEIPDRSTPEGVKWEWKLANTVRTIDPTRPVTAALNGLLGPLVEASAEAARPGHAGEKDNASSVFLNVAGYNYRLEQYEPDHAAFPSRIMVGTETFPSEAWDYVRLTDRAPYALGEFVWTAMDYLGEAGIGATTYIKRGSVPFAMAGWPWVVSWCGDIDLTGNQKMPSLFRDVAWGLSKLEMAVHRPVPEGKTEFVANWGWPDVVQSWTWPEEIGKSRPVHLYTSGDRVELLLNGEKVGDATLRPEDRLRAVIDVPYAPGVLEAVAYAGGREIARRRLETVSAPAQLRARPEADAMGKGRLDLGYLAIEVLDTSGRVIPDAEVEVTLEVSGPAELAGFGSANPLAVGSFQRPTTTTYAGRALAILRGQGRSGSISITATSPGLTSAGATLRQA